MVQICQRLVGVVAVVEDRRRCRRSWEDIVKERKADSERQDEVE